MSRPNPPKTYDEIVRSTVADPDSSMRPTRTQEKAAREGFRALDADEQVIHDRVTSALASIGATGVTAEINRELVTLRGRVPTTTALREVEDSVALVSGVETIHNQIVIGN
jgi:osmotically-inducible protein OsmY